MEAMPDGGRAAGNAVDLDRDDLLAEDADDDVQRSDPAQIAGAPAHRLRPGEVPNDPSDSIGENIRGGTPFAFDDREEYAIAVFELLLAEAGFAQKAFERLRGRRGARPLHLFAGGLRRVGDVS